jgi:transcriptional regulator with XRE-family HTH domain
VSDDQAVRESVGRRLKQARELAGRTQQEAGELVGMSHQSIAAYERGSREPSIPVLVRLAAAYGCQVGDFFARVDDEPMSDEPLSKRTAALERQLRTLRSDVYAAFDHLRADGLLPEVK